MCADHKHGTSVLAALQIVQGEAMITCKPAESHAHLHAEIAESSRIEF